MSDRKFGHKFIVPVSKTTKTTTTVIRLATAEIAEAAIQEIIQTSLSGLPFNLLLNQLLDGTDEFRWIAQGFPCIELKAV